MVYFAFTSLIQLTTGLMLDSNNSVSKTAHNDATVKIKHSKKFWQCFWLSFLVLSLAYAWYCFYVPGNKINWANSFVAAQQQSVETGKPIVLYFTASWCVPCRIMKRQVWADVEVTDIINEDFIPLSIDIDNLDHAELMNRYQIKG
ncbi:MAG: thioredoxin family protein [Pirellulaceae bacterium]